MYGPGKLRENEVRRGLIGSLLAILHHTTDKKKRGCRHSPISLKYHLLSNGSLQSPFLKEFESSSVVYNRIKVLFRSRYNHPYPTTFAYSTLTHNIFSSKKKGGSLKKMLFVCFLESVVLCLILLNAVVDMGEERKGALLCNEIATYLLILSSKKGGGRGGI